MKGRAKKASDIAAGYNRFKDFNGQQYTGMKVGRTHHWYYDKGDWKEKKVTPEKWEFAYTTVKRRAGHAPEGSGVPVGTGYHWFMLSHQYVEKLNANDYMTQMVELKFKLAHKRANKEVWNASTNAQRKHLIKILKDMIAQLEKDPEQVVPVPLELTYKSKSYKGRAIPVPAACTSGACFNLDVTLNGEHLGIMRQTKDGWKIGEIKSKGLANAIGDEIARWYKGRKAA